MTAGRTRASWDAARTTASRCRASATSATQRCTSYTASLSPAKICPAKISRGLALSPSLGGTPEGNELGQLFGLPRSCTRWVYVDKTLPGQKQEHHTSTTNMTNWYKSNVCLSLRVHLHGSPTTDCHRSSPAEWLADANPCVCIFASAMMLSGLLPRNGLPTFTHGSQTATRWPPANLQTQILCFVGFDSSRILM